jgi:hypothetical protein
MIDARLIPADLAKRRHIFEHAVLAFPSNSFGAPPESCRPADREC